MNERRTSDLALLLLRLSGVGLALAHGLGKATGLLGGSDRFVEGVARLGFPAPVTFAWAAALVELVGGLLIAVGLATRVTAALAATVMAVAAFVRHHALAQLGMVAGLAAREPDLLASWGSPEKSLLFLVVFLALVLLGPGRWSLDHLIAKRRRRRRF
jgi:putative oxidoreductase